MNRLFHDELLKVRSVVVFTDTASHDFVFDNVSIRFDLYNNRDSSAPSINQWSSYARDLISQVFFEVRAISLTFKEKTKLGEYFICA